MDNDYLYVIVVVGADMLGLQQLSLHTTMIDVAALVRSKKRLIGCQTVHVGYKDFVADRMVLLPPQTTLSEAAEAYMRDTGGVITTSFVLFAEISVTPPAG